MGPQSDFQHDTIPTLFTERLIMRPFAVTDGPIVRELAGNVKVAENTLNMPYPYPEGEAEKWIATHNAEFIEKRNLVLAICNKDNSLLIGCIGLQFNLALGNAELGYWIGEPYWNKGYATEAARAMIRYGFKKLGLHKIFANVYVTNPASAKVLKNCGMKQEGYLEKHIRHWGSYKDILVFGVTSV
ncbi:MAG TPA: GNAT family N-acetyltransferase [Bacteroidales bacterium]|nr:GNAT family N-acetyltransferase [Bacteroidales bacterium]